MDIDIAIWLLVVAGLISDMADMADIASVRQPGCQRYQSDISDISLGAPRGR